MKIFMENWRRFLAESKEDVIDKIEEIRFNSAMALSVFRDEGALTEAEEEELDYEVSLAENPDEEIVKAFYDSLYGGQRAGFLSPYSHDELRMMDLYKLKGHNAGFAIKDGDDIVSVHNNSELSSLGRRFMRKAKDVGGRKLDHFDGFLSGLYRKHGFTEVYEIYQWDEQYAPDVWKFEKVNIMDPSSSVYAKALTPLVHDDPDALPNKPIEVEAEGGLKIDINPSLKHNSYKYGRPDVIMRRLR
jgi:hypothetical protein